MSFKTFKKKLSSWLEDFFENSLGLDVDADVAKRNCRKYKDEYERKVKREQKRYVEYVCDRIKTVSRMGGKSIKTRDSLESFMTHDYMMELKDYFEQRGFCVEVEKSDCLGVLATCLRISWE